MSQRRRNSGGLRVGTTGRGVRADLSIGQALLTAILPLILAGCGAAVAGAGDGAAEETLTRSSPAYTRADVEFMQGMIAHHRQALAMTELVPARSGSDAIRLLAERIEVSQTDEIALMAQWLETRGEEVPPLESHPHGHAHGELMPGMLTQEEMARLAAASGPEFDRLFLELMIRHHEGALFMVGQLLATPGAAQDVDAFRIASEVDSDQRIEIERMTRMLNALG